MPPIRVVIQQPALTRYRVPVFRELARRPGLDLLVVYGDEEGIANVQPEGFEARLEPLRDVRIGGAIVRYHPAQYAYATRDKCDVMVLSWSTRYATLLPALVRCRWNGVASVLWGHGYSKAETRLRRRSRGALADLADALLFYNYGAAQAFIDEGRVEPERAFVALNTLFIRGIWPHAKVWRDDPARLAAFREANGLSPGPVVLFVSRLYEANRTDLLVHAAAALRAEFPALRVVVIGDGPNAARLRRLAADQGVGGTVKFVGSLFSEDELAPWFVSADVFCYPANIGLSIIHALAYDLPVVTSDKLEAQNPEIEALRPGVNGLTYRDGDAADLAETLREYFRDAALQTRLKEGAKLTGDDYTIVKMVDGMEAAIRYAACKAGLKHRKRP